MKQLNRLIDGIAGRINAGLGEHDFNTDHFIHSLAARARLIEYCASYDATSRNPILLNFHECNIAGSHFLGKCRVDKSVVYKSDIRGDELKRKGDSAILSGTVPLSNDEIITISNSFLFKILIHSKSHNPETPGELFVRNTAAGHYATIHGSTLEGCWLGAFATVDRTALHTCLVGEFSYIQVDDLYHEQVKPGTVRVENEHYSFCYTYPKEILDRYVFLDDAFQPTGVLYEFAEERKADLERCPRQTADDGAEALSPPVLNRFAVIRGNTRIGKGVSIRQRVFIENSEIGDGSTAQENSCIIDSKLSVFNIVAHGGKVIHASLGMDVFVGINSFLNGRKKAPIVVGEGCIIMPHTIIDPVEPVEIPAGRLVWGFIASGKDVDAQSIALTELTEAEKISMGEMVFEGRGDVFAGALKERIHTILESGEASNDGTTQDSIQDSRNTRLFTIQPYGTGPKNGIYPTIKIEP